MKPNRITNYTPLDKANMATNLLFVTQLFFNSDRPLTGVEFVKCTADKNHAQEVYNFGIQQLIQRKKKRFAVFSKIYSNNQDRRIEIMGLRANFRKMAD